MNEQLSTEALVWEQPGQFIEMLLISMLIVVAVHFVAMVIMIVCLCRETTRAGHLPPETTEPGETAPVERNPPGGGTPLTREKRWTLRFSRRPTAVSKMS